MVYTLKKSQISGHAYQAGGDISSVLQGLARRYFADIAKALNNISLEQVEQVVRVVERARDNGKHVFVLGNGGSAATASHFACDLAKGAINEGKPRIKALALTDSAPLFSAWANDSDYGSVFAEQLRNYVEPDDVVIAISGSGNSMNVVNAVVEARDHGAVTIGFTGFEGGRLISLVDIAMHVRNYVMEQVEDAHLILAHLITTLLRQGHSNIICATTDIRESRKPSKRS